MVDTSSALSSLEVTAVTSLLLAMTFMSQNGTTPNQWKRSLSQAAKLATTWAAILAALETWDITWEGRACPSLAYDDS